MDHTSHQEQLQHAPETLKLGISSCLHGAEVRFNGAHKRDDLLLGTIGRYVRWVPVCPEVEFGLGVPRETLRLEGDPANPRLVQTQTRKDITDGMREWSKFRLATLYQNDLDGFIAKKNSPSCGVFRVKLYDANGSPLGRLARDLRRRARRRPSRFSRSRKRDGSAIPSYERTSSSGSSRIIDSKRS